MFFKLYEGTLQCQIIIFHYIYIKFFYFIIYQKEKEKIIRVSISKIIII